MTIASYWRAHTQIPGFEQFPPETVRLMRRMFYSGFNCALAEWHQVDCDDATQNRLFDEWLTQNENEWSEWRKADREPG